jgi:predicted negative regulator of RcsB-dependent stress response
VARKPKHQQDSAAQTLDALESRGDQLAEWIGSNPLIIMGVAGAILLVVGVYGLMSSRTESSQNTASLELSELQSEYREAMGASPEDVDIVEPANPETALQVRTEYVERFRELAASHSGTSVGALAALEEADLQQATDNVGEAIATLDVSLAQLAANEVLRGVLLSRKATLQEASGAWSEAAETFELAAAVESYPLRYGALAEAARCFAEAGMVDRALGAFARIEAEAPEQKLPEHIESRLRELKLGQTSG